MIGSGGWWIGNGPWKQMGRRGRERGGPSLEVEQVKQEKENDGEEYRN